jgi:hypothetical protein
LSVKVPGLRKTASRARYTKDNAPKMVH